MGAAASASASLSQASEADLREAVDRLSRTDKDKLVKALEPHAALDDICEGLQDRIRAAFDVFDLNRNGFLEREEFTQTLKYYCASLDEPSTVDTDFFADGKISPREFRWFLVRLCICTCICAQHLPGAGSAHATSLLDVAGERSPQALGTERARCTEPPLRISGGRPGHQYPGQGDGVPACQSKRQR